MHAALKPLVDAGWVEERLTSADEMRGLLSIVQRRLDEAQGSLKYPDSIFGLAYDAVRSTATIVVRAHGVRVKRDRFHEMTFAALGRLGIPGLSDRAPYYDDCRRKRNAMEYDSTGDVSNAEAQELVKEAARFARAAQEWVRSKYPELL
jgi:hypothetical protein